MATTAIQLRTRLRNKLRDPNGTLYDNNGELDQALEDAQNEIIMRYDFRFIRAEETQTIVDGQEEYDVPTDLLFDRIHWIEIKDGEEGSNRNWFRLRKITYDDYKRLQQSYTQQTGLPIYWCFNLNEDKFFLWPEPNYDYTNGMVINYFAKPTALTSGDTTEMILPDEYSEALILLALAKTKEIEEEFDQADRYEDRAYKLIRKLKAQASETKDSNQRFVPRKGNIYTKLYYGGYYSDKYSV